MPVKDSMDFARAGLGSSDDMVTSGDGGWQWSALICEGIKTCREWRGRGISLPHKRICDGGYTMQVCCLLTGERPAYTQVSDLRSWASRCPRTDRPERPFSSLFCLMFLVSF